MVTCQIKSSPLQNQAIHSLDVTVKTLAKIKTVFDNTRVYWKSMENHCNQLKDNEMIVDLLKEGMIDDFKNQITGSTFEWLTLANLNHKAVLSIEGVDRNIDNVMNNLPTTEQAAIMIEPISSEILFSLKEN